MARKPFQQGHRISGTRERLKFRLSDLLRSRTREKAINSRLENVREFLSNA